MFSKFLDKNIDLGLLVLRVSIGGLMVLHGIKKISADISFIKELVVKIGLPVFTSYGVFLGELIAPIMILIGYKTRFASLIFFLTCLFIIFVAHPSDIFKLNEYGGWQLELVGLYAFGSLALMFAGGGKYAITKE
ncbi:MAG TPA: DoxX family protein [Saprospiraceae bacterium]|nr:DoxX family protein [Saprospiraceae bacterium]